MAGMFDNSMVLQVQQANDIVDVIGEHVSLKKKGREMVGLCPFHDDHSPSMNVNRRRCVQIHSDAREPDFSAGNREIGRACRHKARKKANAKT